VIRLDTETFSATPIKAGTYRYASDCEVMVVTYTLDDDDPAKVWDVTSGEPMPGDLAYWLLDTDEPVTAHNAMFDRNVLRLGQLKLALPIERWRCTMVKALAHSLPGKLEALCTVLGVEQDKAKLKTGAKLIQLFCKPRPKSAKITRATSRTHPAEWAEFLEYARIDCEALREVDRLLPNWNWREQEIALWHLDQKINDRGFAIDVEMAEAAVRTVKREQRRLAEEVRELTNEEVQAATQRDRMLMHILTEYGVALPDLTASTIERRIDDPDLPRGLRDLLALRQDASTSSTTKYTAMLRSVTDGRLRGTLQFNGASRTGRWAGRIVQPQNFARPTHEQEEIDEAIELLKADVLDLVSNDCMKLISSALRGTIIAPPGRKLNVADLSNIEGRMLAWLAGEEWKLQAFRDFDAGTGPDLYKLAYARSFGIPHEQVTKAGRQIGKVQELSLGYEGGVGAFVSMGENYGLDAEAMAEAAWASLPRDVVHEAEGFYDWALQQKRPTFGLSRKAYVTCDTFKRLWRGAHPGVVSLWDDLDEACIAAVRKPGNTIRVRSLLVASTGAWLRIRLPSGRYLCYPNPKVKDDKLSYMGMNQYTRQWQRIGTHGGKLVENVTQAAARDVLVSPMHAIEADGYAIVLSVHDELITESDDTEQFDWKHLAAHMATVPSWAPGLPLAAAGFSDHRYKKKD